MWFFSVYIPTVIWQHVGISSQRRDLAEGSRTFCNLSFIYKICSSLYILIGLQTNILYSKPNQRATPFLRYSVSSIVMQIQWLEPYLKRAINKRISADSLPWSSLLVLNVVRRCLHHCYLPSMITTWSSFTSVVFLSRIWFDAVIWWTCLKRTSPFYDLSFSTNSLSVCYWIRLYLRYLGYLDYPQGKGSLWSFIAHPVSLSIGWAVWVSAVLLSADWTSSTLRRLSCRYHRPPFLTTQQHRSSPRTLCRMSLASQSLKRTVRTRPVPSLSAALAIWNLSTVTS